MGTPGAHAPTRLGRYELIARLAAGGMGEIFLARLEGAAGFEKLFVVKRILPHLADDLRFRAMLIAEAQIASKMSHANICQVYELGETGGQLFIVMEYLEGISILPLLRRSSKAATPLDLGFIAGVIQQTTDALHYAHELRDRSGEYMGVVHRDVTPANIFLTESGVAKVLDFGIAKVKDASAHTQTGAVKGKYAYMAPEQLRGAAIDRRADVFALGVVTYELLALRRLFQRQTDYLTFRAVIEQPIPDVRRYRPEAPEALAEVIMRALDRDPERRYATARLLGTALLDAIGKRAWSQGELSDFVRTTFADEIKKRSDEIAIAIGRSEPGSARRTTIPMLVASTPPEPDPEDYDDDEFPSVESTVSDAPPLEAMRAQQRQPTNPADFNGHTPPPFDGDSNASGPSLRPLLGSPGTSLTAAPAAKRNLVWPLLAIAMVGIAGGALFLVWRQTQRPRPPPIVNITTTPANPGATAAPVEPPVADAQPPDPVDVASVSDGRTPAPVTSAKMQAKPGTRPRKAISPYDAAIVANKPKINRCAQEHGLPPEAARVVIVVLPSGKAKTVSLEPDSLNQTPLGTCIRNVLSGATFPPAKDEMKVAVALKAS